MGLVDGRLAAITINSVQAVRSSVSSWILYLRTQRFSRCGGCYCHLYLRTKKSSAKISLHKLTGTTQPSSEWRRPNGDDVALKTTVRYKVVQRVFVHKYMALTTSPKDMFSITLKRSRKLTYCVTCFSPRLEELCRMTSSNLRSSFPLRLARWALEAKNFNNGGMLTPQQGKQNSERTAIRFYVTNLKTFS